MLDLMNLFGRSKAVKGGKEGGKEWNISIFWAGSCVSLWDEKCGKKFKNNSPTECTKGRKLLHSDESCCILTSV